MTCEDVSASEIVEKYLLGQLSDDVRDSFEQHYFECARCFGVLQTFREVQAELARTRAEHVAVPKRSWVWQWAWVPALAIVLLAVSVAVWQPPIPETSGPSSENTQPAPAPVRPPAEPVKPSLDDLARLEPPGYTPGRLRGAADAATAKFQEAMDHYQRRNYLQAAALLGEASTLDPEAAHIAFFLGISQLLAAQPDAAINALRKTVALGDSPYLEEAHFYLAKAYLRKENVDDAITELEHEIRLRGEHEPEARQLLDQLQAFKKSSQR
jgi:tetratricopeptide (TPR) repeat protein